MGTQRHKGAGYSVTEQHVASTALEECLLNVSGYRGSSRDVDGLSRKGYQLWMRFGLAQNGIIGPVSCLKKGVELPRCTAPLYSRTHSVGTNFTVSVGPSLPFWGLLRLTYDVCARAFARSQPLQINVHITSVECSRIPPRHPQGPLFCSTCASLSKLDFEGDRAKCPCEVRRYLGALHCVRCSKVHVSRH